MKVIDDEICYKAKEGKCKSYWFSFFLIQRSKSCVFNSLYRQINLADELYILKLIEL